MGTPSNSFTLSGLRATCLAAHARALTVLTVAMIATPISARALDLGRIISFNIEAQPLDSALIALSKQSHVQILIAPKVNGKMNVPGVSGLVSVRTALDTLLQGSGLKYAATGDSVSVMSGSALSSGDGTDVGAGGGADSTGRARSAEQTAQLSPVDQASRRDRTVDDGSLARDPVQEVVVTAQKREERLIDVPISIAALTGEDLQRRGVISILDLPSVVPDLAVYSTGVGQVFEIRGISNIAGGSSALVGLYLDEADVTVSQSSPIDVSSLYDLERIEVLRGPQGTLYGEGSAGGTIRFVTKNPDLNRFAMSSDVTASFTEGGAPSQRIDAMLNVPLVSNVLGLRLVGTFRRDGGWINQPAVDARDINGNDLSGLRAKGLWQPNSNLKISAMADISRSDRGQGTGEDAMGNYTQVFELTTMPRLKVDHDLYNLTLTYDFSSVQVLNTLTYLKEANDSRNVAGTSPAPPPAPPFQFYIPHVSVIERAWIDELRMTTTGQGPWKWTTGVFYRHDRNDLEEQHYYFGPPGPLSPDEDEGAATNTALSKSWSAFGDTSYALTERVTVGAGVRYFRDSRGFDANYQSSAQAAVFHSIDPRGYVQFKLAEGINVYASGAKGFRSGGFNFPDPSTPPTFAPEKIWTYELGAKMSLLEGRLGFDTAFFYTNYSDYQTLGAPAQLGVPATYNGGDARIKGAEWNMTWRPTDLWQLTLNGNYLHGRFTAINLTQTSHLVGDELDFVPKYQFAASVQRGFHWRQKPGFARLDYSQQGPQVLINRAIGPWFFGKSDTIRLLNFRTALQVSDNLNVALFAQNLLNDRGFLNPDYIESYSPRSRPRTYGIEFSVAFD
jgi:iron complex outermembrane recepter protein